MSFKLQSPRIAQDAARARRASRLMLIDDTGMQKLRLTCFKKSAGRACLHQRPAKGDSTEIDSYGKPEKYSSRTKLNPRLAKKVGE